MNSIQRSACACGCVLLLTATMAGISSLTDFTAPACYQSSDIAGGERSHGEKLLKGSLSFEYSNEHALYIKEEDGDREFFVVIDNGKKVVYRCSSNCSIAEANSSLYQIRQNVLDELKSIYRIDFSNAGVACKATGMRDARPAKLGELLSLSYALSRSVPSYLSKISPRSKSVSIVFLSQPFIYGSVANWTLDSTGSPIVNIEPSDTMDGVNLDRVLVHELAHNACYRLGWRAGVSETWGYFTQLGWKHFHNPVTGEFGWRILTTDGGSFKKISESKGWVRCNDSGQILAASGERVRRLYEAERLSSAEVSQLARVRPVSMYFPTPMEHFAEGMMMYRYSATTHRYLKEHCPALCDVVERADQAELDRTFGQGKYTRFADGTLRSLHDAEFGTSDAAYRKGVRLEIIDKRPPVGIFSPMFLP